MEKEERACSGDMEWRRFRRRRREIEGEMRRCLFLFKLGISQIWEKLLEHDGEGG